MANEKEQYRVVENRIITEKQYQSEQATKQLTQLSSKYSNITVPAAIAVGLISFYFTASWNDWFWKILVAFMAAAITYTYFFAGVGVAIIWGLYKLGAFS